MIIVCSHCKKEADKPKGAVNRALKINAPLYCDKACSGLARRDNKSLEEKRRLKSEYDKQFRKLNAERIKKAKSEAFKKDYKNNPEKYKLIRQKRKEEHKQYCRRPEYKKWKAEYDKKHLAKKNYGEFAECFLLIKEIEKEYNQQEVRQINNLHNKSQKRKQQWKQKQNYLQRI